ncbi:EAL domain-containing protein [Photobacterium sp. DNB22_13_2]
MNLFRYTFSWIASTFTALLLCFVAIHSLSIRGELIKDAQQQLHSSTSYIEQRLGLLNIQDNPAKADYPMLLEQLSQITPQVQSHVQVLASNHHFSSPALSQSRQVAPHPTLFWPTISLQRILFGNSEQAIQFTAVVPIDTITTSFWLRFLPGVVIGTGIYLLILLLLFILLKRKLQPLTQLALQSSTIGHNSLSSVTLNSIEARAWVKMSGRFKKQLDDIFQQQADEANKLKAQAYQDKVSGLGNRHYFINQLNAWLENSQQGGLILLKSTLLDEVYQQYDFEKGDTFTRKLADEFNANIIHAQVYLARLSYDEFAVLLPNIATHKLLQVAEAMIDVHRQQEKAYRGETTDSAFLGLLMIEQANSSSHILGQLDNILAQALRNPAEPIQLADNQHQVPSFGKQQWKSLLLDAIDNNAMSYQYQPVVNEHQQPLHFEVFSSLKAEQSRYNANQFLGAIEDVGAGGVLDKHVIAHHVNVLNGDQNRGPFAINLTTNSITDPAFNRWLDQMLSRNQHLSQRLHFEIPESCFIRTPDACGLLCSAIRFYKFRYGVDGYGRYFKSLSYLDEFRPDYVKVDFSYTHQLNDDFKKQLLSSICRTAHSLNIMTIATRVETETQLERLSELFVSGFQGFFTEHKVKEKRLPTLPHLHSKAR